MDLMKQYLKKLKKDHRDKKNRQRSETNHPHFDEENGYLGRRGIWVFENTTGEVFL